MQDFLPVNKKEMKERGWEQADILRINIFCLSASWISGISG